MPSVHHVDLVDNVEQSKTTRIAMQAASHPPPLPPRPAGTANTSMPPALPARGLRRERDAADEDVLQTGPDTSDEARLETATKLASADEASLDRARPHPSSLSPPIIQTMGHGILDVGQSSKIESDSTRSIDALDLPSIVNTQASTPEASPVYPTHRLHRSISATSVASSAASDISSSSLPRPSIQLFGRQPWKYTDEQYAEALEELQTLEVDEFLSRVSKNIEEVNFDPRVGAPPFPDRAEYFKTHGTSVASYIEYFEAWLCATAEARLPQDLLAVEKPDRFSFSHSRLALERLYVLLPPSLLEKLLAGHLVNLYRWKDPLNTLKWATLYLALWYYDQLPAAVYALVLYAALKRFLFPPTATEVRKQLADRRLRSREAQELDDDLSKREKMSAISQSLASSVGVAAIAGGIGMRSSSPGPSVLTSSDSDTDDKGKHGRPARRRRSKFGMYRLVRELLDRFGPSTMMLLGDAADYMEKCKNFVLWRRPQATKTSLVLIAGWTLLLSVTPGWLQLKALLLWFWFQFFIVWPIQDRHPRYRRALNPFWWLLWNVPNDAESALEILKARASAATLQQESGLPRSASATTLQTPKRMHRRSISNLSHFSHSSIAENGQLFKHFALYKGIPGHLAFESSHFAFGPMRGMRSISSRIFKRPGKQAESLELFKKKEMLFREPMAAITSVRKEARADIGIFDTDGLQITVAGGKVYRFSAVQKRDEAFSFILAHSVGSQSGSSTPN